ncbi:unnamed protein product [Trichobilharzia regenti]|nr:unnamed protein product [Trichobilharzia regenti]
MKCIRMLVKIKRLWHLAIHKRIILLIVVNIVKSLFMLLLNSIINTAVNMNPTPLYLIR